MVTDTTLVALSEELIAAVDCEAATIALRRRCPDLYQQIKQTAADSTALKLWGQSFNQDEIAKQRIVHPHVLRVIAALTGVPMMGQEVHAGLQHTYGYLFSLIETTYGCKRDRWMNAMLDRAFGFDTATLQPVSKNGTLFFNATYFLGRIVFRGHRREIAMLRRLRSLVDPALTRFNYRKLKVARLVETVCVPKDARSQVSLITDIVQFTAGRGIDNPPTTESALLIYSVADSRQAIRKLITVFPVSVTVAETLLDPDELGQQRDIRLRYNASVDHLPRSIMTGSRELSGTWTRKDA
ncbi:MAG: hypothetical protein HON53_17705 [Planctomycetaceae bacterium]|jgi:hypothetical protein|nr:hypothetical protein [Planctomycetaceae bacterium]MBT6157967.1 hypothetical protein [Planctomycetaceae bacterium]MBT6487396.1 hypothetical protein [Planctomycetaceae bacterium]MBT6496901.1 hypothetical protein [Planctomycetaceae bacterium]